MIAKIGPTVLFTFETKEGMKIDIKDVMKTWNKKPKELVVFLTEKIKKDKRLFPQLIETFKSGSDVEKGTCAEVMKFVSKADYCRLFSHFNNVLIVFCRK